MLRSRGLSCFIARCEIEPAGGALGRLRRGGSVRHFDDRRRRHFHERLAAMVVDQVRRDAEQVVAAMIVVLERRVRAQEPIVGFLQQIVRQAIVAGHARQIDPDRPRRQLVERAEGLLGHLERPFGFVEGAEAFHVGQRDVTHWWTAIPERVAAGTGRAATTGR